MTAKESLNKWTPVANQPGLYRRVSDGNPSEGATKPQPVSPTVKALRSELQSLIAEANARTRS